MMRKIAGKTQAEYAKLVRSLVSRGASLLPVGVTKVQGDFHRGDVIAVPQGWAAVAAAL